MSPNDALTYITVIGAVGTGLNLYLTLRIANSIAQVQLWAKDNFVAKSDLAMYIRRFRSVREG